MHVLLSQELANTRAQHSATVCATAIGCATATFELHFPALIVDDGLKHRNGTAIAIAVAGLEWALLDVFSAVDRQCVARRPADLAHRRWHLREVAGEHTDEVGGLRQTIAQAKLGKKAFAARDILRVFDCRGIDGDIMAREDLSRRVVDTVFCGIRITVERIHEGIVCQGRKIVERC